MKENDVFKKENICILDASTKKECLLALIDRLRRDFSNGTVEEMSTAIFYRESLMSTGIGLGVGVPHIRTDLVSEPIVHIGLCRKPVTDYESMDGKPIILIVLALTNRLQHREHTRILARIVSLAKRPGVMEALASAETVDDVHEIFRKA